MDALTLGGLSLLAILGCGIVIVAADYLQSRRSKDQQWRDETAVKTMEWAQWAVRETQSSKRELEEVGERMMETRYLLAEACKLMAATQIATLPTTLYNDFERLAAEAVRGYEEEGRHGTPRCIPFPPPFKGGSE